MRFWNILAAAALSLLTGFHPGMLHAQKGQLKGTPVAIAKDTLKPGGKGSLKGAPLAVQDTLKGGDGFIPRTVIDSFPRQPDNRETRKITSVTPKDLEESKARISSLQTLVTTGDSILAMRRMDPQPEWPETRVSEFSDALESAKLLLKDAEKRHAALLIRYDNAMTIAQASAPKAAPTPPSKPADKAPAPAAKPSGTAPAPVPATPPATAPAATDAGKGKLKGGN